MQHRKEVALVEFKHDHDADRVYFVAGRDEQVSVPEATAMALISISESLAILAGAVTANRDILGSLAENAQAIAQSLRTK